MFWKLHCTVQSNFEIKIGSNALTMLRSENLWKLRTAMKIKRSMKLQVIICRKRAPFFAFSVKHLLTRKKCYQCKLVCAVAITESCKKLMPLSHFGEFDCDFTANQFAAQSQRSLRRVAEHGESSANALRIDLY